MGSKIGERIQATTPRDALVIIVGEGLTNPDPRYFYWSRRRGWPMDHAGVSPEVLHRLVQEGAGYLAWIEEVERPDRRPGILDSYPYREWAIRREGKQGGTLRLYRLGKAA